MKPIKITYKCSLGKEKERGILYRILFSEIPEYVLPQWNKEAEMALDIEEIKCPKLEMEAVMEKDGSLSSVKLSYFFDDYVQFVLNDSDLTHAKTEFTKYVLEHGEPLPDAYAPETGTYLGLTEWAEERDRLYENANKLSLPILNRENLNANGEPMAFYHLDNDRTIQITLRSHGIPDDERYLEGILILSEAECENGTLRNPILYSAESEGIMYNDLLVLVRKLIEADKSEQLFSFCVYRDTMGPHDADENLADVLVTKAFAYKYYEERVSARTDNRYGSAEEFFECYTADDTQDFFEFAKSNDAIIRTEAARIELYNLVKTYEDNCTIREHIDYPLHLTRNEAVKDFEREKAINPVFRGDNIHCEYDGFIESQFTDGMPWCRLEIAQNQVSLSKAQLKAFLGSMDSKTLLESLPDGLLDVKAHNPLDMFIENEVPFRMEELYNLSLEDDVKNELVEYVKKNTDILFNYDRLDQILLSKYEELKANNK